MVSTNTAILITKKRGTSHGNHGSLGGGKKWCVDGRAVWPSDSTSDGRTGGGGVLFTIGASKAVAYRAVLELTREREREEREVGRTKQRLFW